MTFQYDAAGALARIKAGLSQRAEDQKPEGNPAKVANPAQADSAAQDGLAGLAGLAGGPVDFHTRDHTTQAVSSPIEDQKSARTPAKVANPANPFPATPLAAGSQDDLPPEGSASVPAGTAAALARRAQFKKRGAVVALRRPIRPWNSEDWLAFYGEKAAISEFDHGMSRQEAEKHANEHCISEWLYQHPMSSDAEDGCLACGDAGRPNDDLLPVGLGGGEVWLHLGCSAAWRAARIAEAVAGLATMGIGRPEGHPRLSGTQAKEGTP